MIIRLNINLITYLKIKNYLHRLPFLKDSRLFSICFCLALSGAAASTLASSSLIWGFRWVSWSARLWRKEGRKKGKHPVTQAGCYSDHKYTQISETETQWMKRRGVSVVPSCFLHISPGCSSCLGAVVAGAGCSPQAAAFFPGSHAALTPSHSACFPYGRATENTRQLSRLVHQSHAVGIIW